MNRGRFPTAARGAGATLLAALLLGLAGCGGGGGGNSNDVHLGDKPAPPEVLGPKSFLLFPNPQLLADGSNQTDSAAYTQAYYDAIDPTGARDTFAKWKTANGFGDGTGTEINVVFGDQKDLGYGRRMTARRKADGTLAFYVENYLIQAGAGYTYSPLNLQAAIVRDPAAFIGINAIEFSPGPNGGASFPKFFNFNAQTGVRASAVDLDGRGLKGMPGPCITCHGGRGDALTPADSSGKPRFNLVQNGASQTRGDVQAHMHHFEVDSFGFSDAAGFTRADQEAKLKTMNQWILCTYPIPAAATPAPEDGCRRTANASEWQGTAATLIKQAYGGDGMPSAAFSGSFVPQEWVTAGQTTLYQNVVQPSCRTCHILRGSAGNSDLDFTSYAKFSSYSDRIKAHLIDRGNMPLAKLVFDHFWAGPGPDSVATMLEGQGFTARASTGAVLVPGRPVADPGPDRTVPQGATALSAAMSLYATGYTWSIVSGPSGATLSSTSGATTTFTATANGSYVVQLVASNGSLQSPPAQLTLVVNSGLTPAPANIRFADIKGAIQGGICTNCHSPTGQLPRPPLFYVNYDRNGDGVVDATDDDWFYAELRSRINFTDIVASPLLRKPSGHHHGGLLQGGFDTTQPPGNPARANYDLFLNWILNGAPR